MISFTPFVHPNLSFRGLHCRTRMFCKLCSLVAFSVLVATLVVGKVQAQQPRLDPADPQIDVFPIDLNLRIVWGSPKSASYVGTIELDSGAIASTRQLGIDPYDPSFLLKDADGRLIIDDAETRFGGCDIRVQAKTNSRLKMQLQITDPETGQSIIKQFTWTLKSLRDNSDLQELGFQDCRLSIDRVPGDRLRVVTSRSHLVYNSDEPLNIQIQPYGLAWFSTTGNLECSLVRIDDDHQVFRKSKTLVLDSRGHGEPFDLLSAAPKEEGVYELRFKFEPKRVLPGILIRHPSTERVVQFVVYNNTSATPASQLAMARPQHGQDAASGWQPQPNIPSKAFDTHSLTSRLAGQVDSSKRFPFFDLTKSISVLPREFTSDSSPDSNGSILQIAPGALARTSITGLMPGQMHRLTLGTSNIHAAFRVSVSSPESKLSEETLVSQVFEVSSTRFIDRVIHPTTATAQDEFAILFWPNSRNARLEITNLNATNTLNIKATFVDVWNDSTDARNIPQQESSQTSCVLELNSANVRSMFGSEAFAIKGNGSPVYDDWRLFLRFAKQIGNYCKANGFDTLAMTVHAEGSTLFPCSKFSSNSRFDTGTFSALGRDPFQKDIVELMYRAMSRYGLEFVPMLELDSPIREVEEAISNVADNDLFQHRDRSRTALNPYSHLYNPLSARVQQAIAMALDEFESRYRSHPNYRGYALRAIGSSHLDVSVPIDQTNAFILERFANAAGGNLPKDLKQRELLIAQRLQSAYSQWLKESVVGFFEKLKTKLRWVSVENDPSVSPSGQLPFLVSPLQVGPKSMDLAELSAMIGQRWNLGGPMPIHVAMDKPVNRFEDSFARLASVAKPTLFQNAKSLAYRDNSRTVSKVRIWISKDAGNSLLVSNSGAVSESIYLGWGNLPHNYQLLSTLDAGEANSAIRLEIDSATMEWQLRVAAGELIRIDLPDGAVWPMYWYCQEKRTLQSLDAAMQALEQAISRLSTPQPAMATISNPSFESQNNSARRGRLSGWTTSIDPNASVDIDSRAATDGKSSIKIESNNSSSIAWIQSDPFALTQSDRLFVAFQSAAQPSPQQVTLSLSKFDPKTERFESIAVRDFADRIQRPKETPNWGMVGVDLSSEFQLASQGNDASLFRLQFEAKGQGRLWLDDVALSTSFLRDNERRDLRAELFLARTSLQQGDSSAAVAMLTSPSGRLLQWVDSSLKPPKVMVSIRDNRMESDGSKLLPVETREPAELNGEPKASEAKLRPVKRLRNYWWPRKE